MSKERVISILEKARYAEEKAVSVYIKHLDSAVFWLGLDKEKVDRIRESLKILSEESKQHKLIVEKLLENIKKGKNDAF